MKTAIVGLVWCLLGSLAATAQQPSANPSTSVAASARGVTRTISADRHAVRVTIRATSRVPDDALERLADGLVIRALKPGERRRTDLGFWRDAPRPMNAARPEVTVRLQPVEGGLSASDFIWLWPDGFAPAAAGVLRVEDNYTLTRPPHEPEPTPLPKLLGPYTRLTGKLVCRAADSGNASGHSSHDLAHLRIEIGQYWATTDATGNFDIAGDFPATGSVGTIRLHYDASVTAAPSIGTRLQVMNDRHTERSDSVRAPAGTGVGTTLDLGTVTVETGDCELWTLGTDVLADFHARTGNSPPAGELRIKRWAGVYDGTPYTFYDYIVLSLDYVRDHGNRAARRGDIAHEFGHSIRHVADGDSAHWNWDNFRWAYGRVHSAGDIANVQFAFNEGWAYYWESVVTGHLPSLANGPDARHLDWNEGRIGHRLADLGAASNPAEMVRVLTRNPGEIHTLYAFEERYCELVTLPNVYCTADRKPVRATPAACPPNFIDEPSTCRLDNVDSKPSYGRGAGVSPTGCGAGREYDAGLCYPDCRAGFAGVGPVCWQRCPAGYHDDGATCRRDADIRRADNSDCPGYDLCGLTLSKGCSRCPAGFHNDGCTCRRDAHIFGKDKYGRGAGTVPDSCRAGKEIDAGLCYAPCRAGFHGVGPVCWGHCPAGYDDHGATCYRPPHVIIKY